MFSLPLTLPFIALSLHILVLSLPNHCLPLCSHCLSLPCHCVWHHGPHSQSKSLYTNTHEGRVAIRCCHTPSVTPTQHTPHYAIHHMPRPSAVGSSNSLKAVSARFLLATGKRSRASKRPRARGPWLAPRSPDCAQSYAGSENNHGTGKAATGLRGALEKLQLEYLDLFLVRHPCQQLFTLHLSVFWLPPVPTSVPCPGDFHCLSHSRLHA